MIGEIVFWYLFIGMATCIVGDLQNNRARQPAFTWDEVLFVIVLWWALLAVVVMDEIKKRRA